MADNRESICKELGFSGIAPLHQFILQSIGGDITSLTRRGFKPQTLAELGYTAEGLRRLGCREDQLSRIGMGSPEPSPPKTTSPTSPRTDIPVSPITLEGHVDIEQIRDLLEQKTPHGALRGLGVSAQHCRMAGADVTLLMRLGFPMSEMVRAFTIHELRRAGYGVRDLTSYFGDDELKSAGLSASEMRMAGRTIKQLQQLGYNENHIRTAGYSLGDLIVAGLAKQTRDHIKGQ
jgi:intracellular multiplication protein IcmE